MSSPFPPGPRPRWWGLQDLRNQRLDYLGFLHRLHQQHGDLCHTRVLGQSVYDVFDPRWAQEVLVRQSAAFQRWERSATVFARTQGEHSVMVLEGDAGQRMRRILAPGFSPKRLALYCDQIVQAASRTLDAVPIGDARGVDIEHAATRLTMDVILQALFSSEMAEEALVADTAVRHILENGMRELFSPLRLPTWFPLPRLIAARQGRAALDRLVWRHLHARQRALAQGRAQRNDLLGMLMQARDEQTGAMLSDREIRDQCMALFMAGHVTTAAALTWWIWSMANHPALARRATEEVDQVVGRWRPGFADVARLPYLTRTLKETLRLYPPAPGLFLRRATAAVQLGPWQVQEGALVRISPWVLHHDPRWFPQPEAFDPERFTPEAQATRPAGCYLPFGVGARSCLGEHFAMAELTLVAAMVLQRFEMTLPAGATAAEPTMHITLRPRQVLRVHAGLRAHAGQATPALNATR